MIGHVGQVHRPAEDGPEYSRGLLGKQPLWPINRLGGQETGNPENTMSPGGRGFLQAEGWTKDTSWAKSLAEAIFPDCWPQTPSSSHSPQGPQGLASADPAQPGQLKTSQARPGQDRTVQDRPGQARTGQARTGQAEEPRWKSDYGLSSQPSLAQGGGRAHTPLMSASVGLSLPWAPQWHGKHQADPL